MPKLTKRQQIINYFTKNPDAPISKVADRFKTAPSNLYPLRKLALAVPVPEDVSTARAAELEPAPVAETAPYVLDFTTGKANARQVGGDHYKEMGIEPWAVVDTWPREQRIGYYRGNALKYAMRLGAKGAVEEDAAKAHHYAQKLMEVLSNAEGA